MKVRSALFAYAHSSAARLNLQLLGCHKITAIDFSTLLR